MKAAGAQATAIAAGTIAAAPLLLLPGLLASLVTRVPLAAVELGWLGTADLAGLAVGSIIYPACVLRGWHRIAMISALLAMVCGDLASGVSTTFATLVMLRGIRGLGAGLILGAVYANLGQARDVARSFAWFGLAQSMLAAIGLGALSLLPPGAAASVSFTTLGVLSGAAALLMARIDSVLTSQSATKQRGLESSVIRPLFGLLLLFTSQGAMWAFAERFAAGSHVPTSTAELFLSIGSGASILAALLASIVGERRGLTVPYLFGAGISGIAILLFWLGQSIETYATAAIFFSVGQAVMLPYAQALVARVRSGGASSSLIGSAAAIGLALGPALAGQLAFRWGLESVTLISLALLVAAMVLIIGANCSKLHDKVVTVPQFRVRAKCEPPGV